MPKRDSDKALRELGKMKGNLEKMQQEADELKKILSNAKRGLKTNQQKMDSKYNQLVEGQEKLYRQREELGEALTSYQQETEKLKALRDRYRKWRGTWAFLLIFLGIFFLSNNITGNAISNLSTNTNLEVGAIFLVAGLVTGFFWLNSKKKR